MEIRYSKSSLKFLAKLEKSQVRRIVKAVEGLTQTPPQGDIKPLQGYSDNRMRLRVGSYRVIYRIAHDGTISVLFVLDIGNRGDIYKKGE